MGRDYCTNLPSELTTNILSRLPLRSLAISKCVCKPWRNLLGSLDFAKSLLSDSETPPALACLTPSIFYNESGSTRCTLFEFQEEVLIEDEEGEDQNQNLHEFQIEEEDEVDCRFQDPIFLELHYNRLTNFYTQLGEAGETNPYSMVSIAANGLLLVYSQLGHPNIPLFIWNPLTRQCINLFSPKQSIYYKFKLSFGFGASRISGEYKVVCINRDGSAHHVYTLGTGTWRRLEAGAASGFAFNLDGRVVCNGNLHWTVYDSTRPLLICGFDVETECFSIFSAPTAAVDERLTVELSVLSDYLCVSYALESEIVIWSMKEYRDEESWTTEYRLSTYGVNFDYGIGSVYPIKVFNDGDVLMLMVPEDFNFYSRKRCLIHYSSKTGTIEQLGLIDVQLGPNGLPGIVKEDLRMIEDVDVWNHLTYAMISTPVLLSLKNFGIENVVSF